MADLYDPLGRLAEHAARPYDAAPVNHADFFTFWHGLYVEEAQAIDAVARRAEALCVLGALIDDDMAISRRVRLSARAAAYLGMTRHEWCDATSWTWDHSDRGAVKDRIASLREERDRGEETP